MLPNSRREFLADVGKGMLVAGLGFGLTRDLGLSTAFAEEPTKRLTFGELEPLVALMQETSADALLPKLVTKLNDGTSLRTLVAAGALANARTFGGQDYTGYHAFMALPPSLEMTKDLPANQAALPVLKVLYRNTARIQEHGGPSSEVLHPMGPHHILEPRPGVIQSSIRKTDTTMAEHMLDNHLKNPNTAYDELLLAVQDEVDVHRVVLAWRAWTMLDIAGKEYAHTLLRQSVRFCVDAEKNRIDRKRNPSEIRELLPKLLDEHKLIAKGTGTKTADDQWVSKLSDTIYKGRREQAAEAVAMALAEGFSPEAVGEAMSLAAAKLVLGDPGRVKAEDGKPVGSVHGASVGVHASDSANAWRNIARVSSPRNRIASLIVGAYHTAGQSTGQKEPERDTGRFANEPTKLLKDLEAAVKANDQAVAVKSMDHYLRSGHDAKNAFQVLLPFAISEDGALHAEKYYRTCREEYDATRPAFRNQHLLALARVTASEHGFPAPGYAEAKRLLKV